VFIIGIGLTASLTGWREHYKLVGQPALYKGTTADSCEKRNASQFNSKWSYEETQINVGRFAPELYY
jgi:hypothetical protein